MGQVWLPLQTSKIIRHTLYWYSEFQGGVTLTLLLLYSQHACGVTILVKFGVSSKANKLYLKHAVHNKVIDYLVLVGELVQS